MWVKCVLGVCEYVRILCVLLQDSSRVSSADRDFFFLFLFLGLMFTGGVVVIKIFFYLHSTNRRQTWCREGDRKVHFGD